MPGIAVCRSCLSAVLCGNWWGETDVLDVVLVISERHLWQLQPVAVAGGRGINMWSTGVTSLMRQVHAMSGLVDC